MYYFLLTVSVKIKKTKCFLEHAEYSVAQNLLGNDILLGPKGYLRATVHNSFFMGERDLSAQIGISKTKTNRYP